MHPSSPQRARFAAALAPRRPPLPQVVKARTSDPEQNYFQDEFDGEGLNIDEVCFVPPPPSLSHPIPVAKRASTGCRCVFLQEVTA